MKPNKRKGRLLSGLLAVIFCMAVFSVSASAAGYYASDESGSKVPPGSIDSITVSTENVELEDNGERNSSDTKVCGTKIKIGAEIGISTQKMHARGPMGLYALTTDKYLIDGDGQVR